MFSSRNLVSPARACCGLFALAAFAGAQTPKTSLSHIAPAITALGKNLGAEEVTTPLHATVWLNVHDRAALDARVKALYKPGSPTFHQWLKPADIKAYMPTEAEVKAVRTELESHGLTVQAVDAFNLSVRVQGTSANFERAFQTKISRYSVKGQLAHTTSTKPELGGAAAGLVAHVAGLNSLPAQPLHVRATSAVTGKPFAGTPVTKGGSTDGIFYASECFYQPQTVAGSGVSNSDRKTPVTASVTGLTYGASPSNTAAGELPPCGYSAKQVQSFYNMNAAYTKGYTGAGQTIVIVDAYTQDTAQADANIFNEVNGLPQLTSSNFQIYNPYGADMSGAANGTDVETDLDVQWAHAMAPGANIALVESFSEDEEDIQAAILYAVTNQLGNTISLSYGEPEAYVGPLAVSVFDTIAQLAAAEGISLHVSSGDQGDDTLFGIPADVNGWASSGYDTVIGGTSIGTSPTDGSVITTGWGNNVNVLSHNINPIYVYTTPATDGYFYAGSGGGVSAYVNKPDYQSALPGTKRLMPDVSALADPFTGVEFVYDSGGPAYVGVVGGTSLSAPLFSGMWAIANEYFGGPLGQAAPFIAQLPSSVIKDVVPFAGPANVTATLTTPTATQSFTANQLAAPLNGTSTFTSALWNAAPGEYIVLTFGMDSSLTVTPGWDNVTGYGTPDFAQALNFSAPVGAPETK